MKLPGIYEIFQNEWEKCQDLFLISDTHFNDEELYTGTKKDIRANAEDYIKLINSKCGKTSGLIHLGDVGDLNCISKLRAGYKMLILGNHDVGHTVYQRKIYKKVFDANKCNKKDIVEIMKNEYPNCHISISDICYNVQRAPFEYYIASADNNLFDRVFQGPVMISEKIILSHEPVSIPWAFNIHGHVHYPGAKGDKSHLNVCPDARKSFEPINFNSIIKNGIASNVESIHRITIDRATINSIKKGSKSK